MNIIVRTLILLGLASIGQLQNVFLSQDRMSDLEMQLNEDWMSNEYTSLQATDVQVTDPVNPSETPTDIQSSDPTVTDGTDPKQKIFYDPRFWTGFTQSFLLITLAEIGDRTFILVTIYSSKLKSNRLLLFFLGVIATSITQIIAGLIGAIFPFLLSKIITEIICILMFFGYGFYMIYDSLCHDEHNEREEERKEILQQIEEHTSYVASFEAENKQAPFLARNEYILYIFMLMCQEWGDKSQFVTISLAANYGVYSIIAGGIVAHIICIVFALGLGMCVEKTLSEVTVNLIGGILFLCFGFYELIFNVLFSRDPFF